MLGNNSNKLKPHAHINLYLSHLLSKTIKLKLELQF
jgi:hypothetical protein